MNYHVAKNGAQLGQMDEEKVVRLLQNGELSPSDLFWTEGMNDWLPLGSKFQNPVAAPAAPAMSNPYAPPISQEPNSPTWVNHLELADR
jgi:GYF domain 2